MPKYMIDLRPWLAAPLQLKSQGTSFGSGAGSVANAFRS